MRPATLDEAIDARIKECKRDAAEDMYDLLQYIMETQMHIDEELPDAIENLLTKARGESK